MSIKQPKNLKKGFTIIEVVLVLAIAGLIFLMVFVALPALQRNQRDTQRKQDYADLSAAVISSAAGNNGKPKGSNTDAQNPVTLEPDKYVNKTGQDPENNAYTVNASKWTLQTPPALSAGKVFVYYEAKCSDGSPQALINSKSFVIYAYLETGTYCNTFEY